MKTYRNEQLGFEIDIPEQWSFRTSDQICRTPGKGHSLIFHCRSNEAFNFQINALTLETTLSHTENEFRQYAQENGYTNLGLGRFKVNDKEHVWARYYVGYGQWAKKYKIVLYGTEYTITATCLEQKLLLEMEKVWDEVAASFRLLRSADKTDVPKNELSEQKGEVPDKHDTEQVTAQDKSAGVKAYRNEEYNFEMDIPQEWSLSTVPVNDGIKFIYTHIEAFNLKIGPIVPEPIPEHTEREFKEYARHSGYTDLQFGRISVGGRDHVWARYQMGSGFWTKKYMIVLGGIEYAMTATTMDQATLMQRETVWDAVVSSIRLIGLSEWLDEGIKAHRVEVGGDLYELAYEAVASGDYSKARPLLEKCLSDNPDHVLAHKELALILKKTGDLQGAISHRREVKRLDPFDTINLYNLADLLAGLGEKEEAWQVIKELQALDPNNPELQRFTNIKDKTKTPDNSKTSPPIAKDVHKVDKEISEAGNNQEKQYTLVFSIISYVLIAAIAFLYIHSKAAISDLLSLNGEISQSLSKSEYTIVVLVLMYGIGALVCLLFLLGVALNRQDASFFNFIDRTMRERNQQQETLGAILFSDYTRSPNGILDALRLQFTNLIRVLFKILMIFFSVGLLPPAMSLVVAILLFGPQFILHHPVPIPWQAGITLLWFYLCYRAMVFWLARMKGIASSGAQPAAKSRTVPTLPSQPGSNEKLRQGNSKIQAAFHILQGISLTESRQGQRAENLEKAIYHFQQALSGFTRQDQPSDWASAQNALGEAYRNLSLLGDRTKNLDQAIFHYQQALEVATRQTDPDLWAAAHNNLGIAYANGASGDQAENVEQAIQHCQQALEVYTRNLLPDDWAMTQNNLGSAYNKRLRGDRANNIEQAISCFQGALEVQSHQADREQWAGTQVNLALAYWTRLKGDRAENLEQVIAHDQQALEVYKRETHPQDWANTHNRMGAAYQIRMRGDPAENLEQAIHHIELALTIYSHQSTPKQWAEAQNTLALAYQGRRRGEQAENIEKAISLFQQALQVYTRRDFPVDWAVTQNYLAFAYEDRVRGDRADNIEQAIGYFQQALKVFTRQAHPEQWAHTHIPLASAYEMRKIGKRDENLDEAARHYQQALEVHTRQDHPEPWAMGQIFLGITCMERKRGKPAEYTAQAIHYYQQAQQVFTRDKYPEEWARIQEGLAAAHNEANSVGLSYPQFYNEESQRQPGQKRTLKLDGSIIPDFPYFIQLLLHYQWDEKLPDDEANRLAKRAIAYISCAIYDAARDAGWPCQASPIPNGRRPAWILDGESSPVSLTLSDIDLSERSCQLTIGAIMTVMGKPPTNRARWEKLHAAFKARFSKITV
jgi:tetratricopeptide (TPR) repeat protein